MNYNTKSIFQNTVAIPDKRVLRAIDKMEDIYFTFEGKIMRVAWNKLGKPDKKGKILFPEKYPNKNGPEPYFLWYYNWKPNIEQLPLI